MLLGKRIGARQALARSLHRKAELVQQPRDVVVVVADAEALLDQVADHIFGPGSVQFTTAEANTAKMVGLAAIVTDFGYTSIDFAFDLGADGSISISEAGAITGGFGSYAAEDVFTIQETTSGWNITKTAALGWDAGAYSVAYFFGRAYVSFTTAESNTEKAAGFSSGPGSGTYADIDFAIYMARNGTLDIYEDGTLVQQVGVYAAGDDLAGPATRTEASST